MVRAAQAKGNAAKALQPALATDAMPKAAVAKAPRMPPPRGGGSAKDSQTLPKAKHTTPDLQSHLADATGVPATDVKLVMDTLWETCAKSLRDTGVFRMPCFVVLRRKRIPARLGGKTKKMFGKEVALQAKPESKKVTACVLKPLKDAVCMPDE